MPEDEFLTPTEAADLLKLSPKTLATWRVRRSDGPPFRRHGRRVLYSRQSLLLWSAGRMHSSTSEYTGPTLD